MLVKEIAAYESILTSFGWGRMERHRVFKVVQVLENLNQYLTQQKCKNILGVRVDIFGGSPCSVCHIQ